MNITELVSVRAREIPDAPAVLTAESTLSYGELDRAVSWTATLFKKAGLAEGDIVAIQLSNQAQHFITSLALARLGAGQIAFDGTDPSRLQQDIVRRLEIVAIIVDPAENIDAGTPRVDPQPAGLPELKRLKSADPELRIASDGALPFLVMRSSGTTGDPKIGILTHAAANARLDQHAYQLPVGPGCRFLSLVHISFIGVKQRAYCCVNSGGCLVLAEKSEPQGLPIFSAEHRINYLDMLPVHTVHLLKIARENKLLFPDIEAFRIGATIVPESLRKEIQKRLTPNLYIGYGSNEVGIISVATPAMVRRNSDVVGKIVPGMQVEIIGDQGQSLNSGMFGKVRLKSPGMISGYIDNAAETKRVFRKGWFYPGDLAEFTAGGALIHHGRADELMILDGINIYPAEIENALLGHEAVAEAAAFPLSTVTRGDVPVAVVATKSNVSVDEMLVHCRSSLGTHAPRRLKIVPELPRKTLGKVLKNELSPLFLRRRAKTRSVGRRGRGKQIGKGA